MKQVIVHQLLIYPGNLNDERRRTHIPKFIEGTILFGDVIFLKELDGILVVESTEGTLRFLEFLQTPTLIMGSRVSADKLSFHIEQNH